MRVWSMRKRVRTISSLREVTVVGEEVLLICCPLVGDELAYVTDKVWGGGTKTGIETWLRGSLKNTVTARKEMKARRRACAERRG